MNLTSTQSIEIPEDIRAWVSADRLVHLLFQAVHAVEERDQLGLKLPPGMPRIFLNLLVYSYAVGQYASDEVEAQLGIDPTLDYLTAKTSPTAQSLRTFRRQHRHLVEDTLSELLQLAWADRALGMDQKNPDHGVFLEEARHRVEDAVLRDTMVLDA